MKVYREIKIDKDSFSNFISALLENLEDKDHEVIASAKLWNAFGYKEFI